MEDKTPPYSSKGIGLEYLIAKGMLPLIWHSIELYHLRPVLHQLYTIKAC